MTAPVHEAARQKVLRLVADGVSPGAAARAAGVSRTTAHRIVTSSSLPFSGGPQPPLNAPKASWSSDQTPPPPSPLTFRPGYHDRSFRSFAEPLSFEGFTVERARNAVALHRQGYFVESYVLSVAIMSFGPILAALQQRVAPLLALPRQVRAGNRGLAKVLGAQLTEQLAPAAGLLPSPYFPPTLWGAMGIAKALAGFAVLQHAYGDEDPEDGTRQVYTRLWPNWAVQRLPGRRTFQAITDAGVFDIVSGDGKFTLVADTEEPHHFGAIVALAEEAIDGKFTQRARASYIDKYGNPKWVGVMPEKVAVRSDEGDAFFDALGTIRGPDGFGALPYGSTFDVKSMASSQSTVFKDAIESNLMLVAMILLGQDGTMSSGSGGVYQSPSFGSVKRDVVDRDIKAEVRGANLGHAYPWLQFNYAASIAQQKARGLWTDPVLEIPLPDPDADARVKSLTERNKALIEQLALERNEGFQVTQDRVDQLSDAYGVDAPVLVPGWAPSETWMAEQKLVAPDEIRVARGLLPLPNGVGTLDHLAKERANGKDQISGRGVPSFEPANAAALIDLAQTVGLQPSLAGVAAILDEAGLGSTPMPHGATPAAHIELAPTDMASIVKVDEARAANGLPPLGPPDGDKMISQVAASPAPGDGGTPAPPGGNGGVVGGEPPPEEAPAAEEPPA
jgi:hypothetical protein